MLEIRNPYEWNSNIRRKRFFLETSHRYVRSCEKIVTDKENTTIINGEGNLDSIKARVNQIKAITD